MKIVQEHVDLSEEQPFLVSIFDDPDLSYPFHQHKKAFELTLTMGLSGTRMVGDSTEQFADKDIVLMAPGLPHCWQDHGLQSLEDHKVVVIQFSEDFVPLAVKSGHHLKGINTALKNSKYGLELIDTSKMKALSFVRQLDDTNSFENYIRILGLLNLFGEESETRKLCSEGYSMPGFKSEGRRLEKALEYIQESYSRKLPIDEVAGVIHMSPSAFSHYFKKRTLKSFTNYIQELRLGKAAQLLQFTEMPVTRVGFESGFQNNSHFNTSFKKKYQLTPLKFRKKGHAKG